MDLSMYIDFQSSPPVFDLPSIPQNRFVNGTDLSRKQTQITDNGFQKAGVQSSVHHSSSRRSVSSNNDKSVKIPFIIHDGFTSDEAIVIKKALQIISDRLFNSAILQNMYQHCVTKGVYITEEAWQCSNLSNHSIHHGTYFLLEYQLLCLKVKYENDQFPIINIYPIYEETYVAGKGSLSCVSCISHGYHLSINGQFEIYLNRYYLHGSIKDSSDTVPWAGVVVHEMLHNLGHNHDDNDYSDKWQINVFTKCFEQDGKY
jgi:hypothetical protein